MSKVQVDTIVDKDDISAPTLSKGAIVTGVCTATTFVGAVTGNVTGNADTATTATSATTATTATNAQGLTGTPNITVGNVTSANVTNSKQTTSEHVNVTGISTLGGDVSIADKIIHTGDTDTAIRFPDADTVTVETGGTERARITSGGFLGLGAGAATNKPLHIYQTTTDSEIRLQTNSGTEQNSYVTLRHATGDLDLYTVAAGTNMKFHTVNGERLRIGASGEIGLSGANYGTSGQVLTSGGSGAAASWATPSGGAWEVVSTQALSSSYTTGYVESTGWSNSYARYAMTFDTIANSSNFKIWIQIYGDNTSGNTGTLITGNDYHSGAWRTKVGGSNSGGVLGFQYSSQYAAQHLLANNTGYSEYTNGEFIFPMNNSSGVPNALKRWTGRHTAYDEEFIQDSGWVSESSYHTTGVRVSFYNTSNNAYVTPTEGRITFLRMKYS